MSESKYITLEQLQKASQSLLIKINEQSDLKVDKSQVLPATTEGTLIGTIAGESFYVPAIDTSEFATQSSMDELTNNLSEVAWTGSYTDLSNLPTIPSVPSVVQNTSNLTLYPISQTAAGTLTPKIAPYFFATKSDGTMTVYLGSEIVHAKGQIYFDHGDIGGTTLTPQAASAKYVTVSLPSASGTLALTSQVSKIWYGICTDEANLIVKRPSCSGFTFRNGDIIYVKFTQGFSYASGAYDWALNVNNTGTKNISNPSADLTCTSNSILVFLCSGSEYVYVGKSHYEIPDSTSDLINDSGFITSAAIPTAVSSFTNDVNYTTQSYVDAAVSSISVPTYSIAISSNRITLTSTAGDSSYIDLPVYDGTVTDGGSA